MTIEPKCLNCGGNKFTFKEIAGQNTDQLGLISYPEEILNQNNELLKKIEELKSSFAPEMEKINQDASLKFKKSKDEFIKNTKKIAEQVSNKMSLDNSDDEVLGFLMGDEEVGNAIQIKQQPLKQKHESERVLIQKSLEALIEELKDKFDLAKKRIEQLLESKIDLLIEESESNTIILTYCEKCGTPISSTTSPRINKIVQSDAFIKQSDAISALFSDIESNMERRNKELVEQFSRIEKVLDKSNKLTADMGNNFILAMDRLSHVMKGVRTSALISGLANLDGATQELGESFGFSD